MRVRFDIRTFKLLANVLTSSLTPIISMTPIISKRPNVKPDTDYNVKPDTDYDTDYQA